MKRATPITDENYDAKRRRISSKRSEYIGWPLDCLAALNDVIDGSVDGQSLPVSHQNTTNEQVRRPHAEGDKSVDIHSSASINTPSIHLGRPRPVRGQAASSRSTRTAKQGIGAQPFSHFCRQHQTMTIHDPHSPRAQVVLYTCAPSHLFT